AHDLTRTCLRQIVHEFDRSRLGNRPHVVAYMIPKLRLQLLATVVPLAQNAESADDVALQLVGDANHRRLSHSRVADEGALHLSSTKTVPGDLNHVVNTANDPDITIFVLTCTIPR